MGFKDAKRGLEQSERRVMWGGEGVEGLKIWI